MAPQKLQPGKHAKQQPLSAPDVPRQGAQAGQLVSLIAAPVPRLERERHPLLSTADYHALVAKCQQLERRVFPKTEAMNLCEELRKPNQYLFVVLLLEHLNNGSQMLLVSYGVLALNRIDCTARIAKVCTDPLRRGLGAGEHLVRSMLAALGNPLELKPTRHLLAGGFHQFASICTVGCLRMDIRSVQLNVDVQRETAVRLYTRCGFSTKAIVCNYYAEGRNALLMSANIS
ncbi:hypothetical protein GGI20_005992 [Coemansia sp. BCRC 34301]|nr:hypothetical protein GGI20_005992 [Coemansia sp. BCRC 34301]